MKEQLRDCLKHRKFDEIADLATQKKRVLNALLSLTFEQDPLIAWRAVEALGVSADRVAERNPSFVKEFLRKLYWLLSDESGGVCWYSPQAMAEIVHRRPEDFEDYIYIILSLLYSMEEEDLAHFRPGVLWAIGRIAPVAGDQIETAMPAVTAALDHSESRVRVMAAWCLKQAGKRDVLKNRPDLLSDHESVEIYDDGHLIETSVAALGK